MLEKALCVRGGVELSHEVCGDASYEEGRHTVGNTVQGDRSYSEGVVEGSYHTWGKVHRMEEEGVLQMHGGGQKERKEGGAGSVDAHRVVFH